MRINIYLPGDLAQEYKLVKGQLNLSALVQGLIRKEIDAKKRPNIMSKDEQRAVTFGRLTLAGKSPVPEGSWVITEQHGERTSSFIVMTTAEARDLRDQIDEELNQEPGGEG